MNTKRIIPDSGFIELRITNDELSFISSLNGAEKVISGRFNVRVSNCLSVGRLNGAAVEYAINEIEDLIMSMIPQLQSNLELRVSGGQWQDIFSLLINTDGKRAPIESVENLYQQLADYAVGVSSAWSHSVSPEAIVLYLVVLREVMHHVGFDDVLLWGKESD